MGIKTVVTESGKIMYDRFHFSQATESNGLLLCSGVIEKTLISTETNRLRPIPAKAGVRRTMETIPILLLRSFMTLSMFTLHRGAGCRKNLKQI